ncbi:MAG: PhnD/SsuA/transferrin family substrate-binding protein [Pseudomonadota bacterium]
MTTNTPSPVGGLPMYDWPEIAGETDRFWDAVRAALSDQGIEGPHVLNRELGEEGLWLHPDLLVGQTCGYPLATGLAERVRYVATLHYAVEGCEGPNYSSVVVARANRKQPDFQNARFAYNSTSSLSGYRTLRGEIGPLEQAFSTLIESGGHRASAQMVARGEADYAALDAVCWHLLQALEPGTAEHLVPVRWCPMRPALPFITALTTPDDVVAGLVSALETAISTINRDVSCPTLRLAGVSVLEETCYSQLAGL